MSAEKNQKTDVSGGMRSRILSSIKLSSLRFTSQIALRLISTVVLTRLLAPEVYGVFAIVLLYRYLLEMFSDLGLRSVVLTKEGQTDETFLQTVWTVSVLRGALILLMTWVIALIITWLQVRGGLPADSAYAAPALPWAIAALSGVALLEGFQTTNRFVYERKMQFGFITINMIAANVVGLIVTIAMAFWLRSIWALVIGAYLQALTLVVLGFWAFKGANMRWSLDRSSLQVVIDRGKWIVGHSILTALAQAADRLVLSLVMNSATFGYYFIARQIVDIGLNFLNTVHAQMGLQVFGHIIEVEPALFRSNYYKYRLMFDALAGLGAGSVFVLAQALVDLVFDDRYADVGPMVELLVFSLLPIGALLLRDAYSAERKFRQMTVLSFVSTVTLWIGLLMSVWLDNVPLALLVIALHRIPEAAILWRLAGQRQWLIPWRETLVLAFFGAGLAFGWIILQFWLVLA